MTHTATFPDYDAAAEADTERIRQLGLSGDNLAVVAQAYHRQLTNLCKLASEVRRMSGSPNRVEAAIVDGSDVKREISFGFACGPPRKMLSFGKLWIEKTGDNAKIKWEFTNNDRYEVGESLVNLS
jgi:hypothetical protein